MSNADRSRLPGGRKRTVRAKAMPDLAGEGGDLFVIEALKELNRSDIPYIVAGTYAVNVYTGIRRPTKDLDIFCRAGDFPRILDHFAAGATRSRSRTSAGWARSSGATIFSTSSSPR